MPDPALRASEVVVSGVRSPVLEGGRAGADEAVVFVHGNPGSSRDWERLAARVAPLGRTIALDMPGFGQADKPDRFPYTVEGYAEHLGGAMDALGVRRAHLVLHDFGGPWGLTWAAAHPARLGSVVLINTGVLPGYRGHYLAWIWNTPLLGEAFMAASSRAGFRSLVKQPGGRRLPLEFVDRMWEDFDRGTRRAILRLYRATRDLDGQARRIRLALRPLERPALVLWGRHDPYVPARYADVQREVFPGAEVVILEQSAHWPFADDPERVEERVVPFVRRQLGVASAEATDTPHRG